MSDFDLTQTDQQVQNILNDAQGAMGASAQTTLTTEYVMLKDTSGIYHKILKSSFTEAIRDVLAGLLVNNDKGTTINQIAAIASGDFGSITPANLASVLGGGYNNSTFSKWNSTTLNGDSYTDLNLTSSSVLIVKTQGHSYLYVYGCLYNRVDEIYKGELDEYGLTISIPENAKVRITNKASSSKRIYWIFL